MRTSSRWAESENTVVCLGDAGRKVNGCRVVHSRASPRQPDSGCLLLWLLLLLLLFWCPNIAPRATSASASNDASLVERSSPAVEHTSFTRSSCDWSSAANRAHGTPFPSSTLISSPEDRVSRIGGDIHLLLLLLGAVGDADVAADEASLLTSSLASISSCFNWSCSHMSSSAKCFLLTCMQPLFWRG